MANPNWKKGVSGNPNGRPKGSGLTALMVDKLRDAIALAEQTDGCSLADFMMRSNDDFWKIILSKSIVSQSEVDVTTNGEAIRSWTIQAAAPLRIEAEEADFVEDVRLPEKSETLETLEEPEEPVAETKTGIVWKR